MELPSECINDEVTNRTEVLGKLTQIFTDIASIGFKSSRGVVAWRIIIMGLSMYPYAFLSTYAGEYICKVAIILPLLFMWFTYMVQTAVINASKGIEGSKKPRIAFMNFKTECVDPMDIFIREPDLTIETSFVLKFWLCEMIIAPVIIFYQLYIMCEGSKKWSRPSYRSYA